MTGDAGGPVARDPRRARPGTGRPPSVAQVRAVCQPPEVLARPVEHWTAGLYLRRLSPYLTRLLVARGAGPDAVTGAMIVTGLLLGPALLVPGAAGVVLVVVLGQLQMLLDCCDGEVARWYRRSSPTGVFLDKLGHFGAEVSVLVGLGLRVGAEVETVRLPTGQALSLGLAAALLVALNRAVNDMVHASRASAGLAPWGGTASEARPSRGPLRALRRLAGLVPVHRVLHSVELTLLIAVAATVGALLHVPALHWLLVGLVPVAGLVLIGHVAAVLSSARLRVPVSDDGSGP